MIFFFFLRMNIIEYQDFIIVVFNEICYVWLKDVFGSFDNVMIEEVNV